MRINELFISFLPHLNAILNSVTFILLLIGFSFIHFFYRTILHHRAMVAAIGVSVLFLISYLIYHFTAQVTTFPAKGIIVRVVYYTVMTTHIILAAVAIPLIAITASHALRGHFKQHRILARWTLPIWLYVSMTGIFVYVALYHVYTS